MVAWHEEIFPTAELFLSCRRKNCNVSTEGKIIYVVGSTGAGAAHQREDITWKEFKRYFEKKYLTKRYYDRKMKQFFELKLGIMTIDEYERRFLELLKYVSFIKDEIVKIQRYLSGSPPSIGDKIQYDDPKTME